MVDDSSVNDQITDSVTQNLTLLADSAAIQGVGMVDVVSAEATGIAMHNAVMSQQHSQLASNASVTATCARMLNTQPEPAAKKKEHTPPPFMPLKTNADATSPEDLLNQLQGLVDNMTKSISKQKTNDENTDKVVDQTLNESKTVKVEPDKTSDVDTNKNETCTENIARRAKKWLMKW